MKIHKENKPSQSLPYQMKRIFKKLEWMIGLKEEDISTVALQIINNYQCRSLIHCSCLWIIYFYGVHQGKKNRDYGARNTSMRRTVVTVSMDIPIRDRILPSWSIYYFSLESRNVEEAIKFVTWQAVDALEQFKKYENFTHHIDSTSVSQVPPAKR